MSAAKAKLIAPNALAEPVSYVYKNTILADYFWRFALSVFGSQTASGGYDVLYSRFLPLLEVEPGLHHFPYLKTSGADGSSPEFFDNTTPDGVREMIETVTNGGDFFIAVLFPADEIPFNSAAFAVDIVYPHSLARG